MEKIVSYPQVTYYCFFLSTFAVGFQTERSFSMMQDLRQSSEALCFSLVSKMLRQLTGQISAHYSSSKIRNTHLRLFRPDRGPHTVI